MKKASGIGWLLCTVLLFTSCAGQVPEMVPTKAGNSAVFIVVRENAISSDSSEVVVRNFHVGARAEMVYRIHNATAKAIMPEIFFVSDANVSDYSLADGAVKAPVHVESWVELPQLAEIPPGQIKEFIVALEMPKGTKKPADKMGFQIGVSGKTESNIQPAVGTWWLVSMR